MVLALLWILSTLAVGGAGWYFGWRQGKRGLPLVK